MRTLAPMHDAAQIQRRSCAWRAGEASPAFRLLFPANLRRLAFGVLRQERFSWKETNGIRNHDGAAALRPAVHCHHLRDHACGRVAPRRAGGAWPHEQVQAAVAFGAVLYIGHARHAAYAAADDVDVRSVLPVRRLHGPGLEVLRVLHRLHPELCCLLRRDLP